MKKFIIIGVSIFASVLFAVTENTGRFDNINTNNPAKITLDLKKNVDIQTTGGLYLPLGTTGQQPSPTKAGMLRYNSTTISPEIYNGSTWSDIRVGNLTGPITSVGNATSVASQTGTGSTFVMNTSPTLITPALGTPSALVGTNITGTASGLTAGSVTTNANLTGAVTSVGNAASLGSFTSANLLGALTNETGSGSAVFATSPTLVTPVLGVASATSLAIGGAINANAVLDVQSTTKAFMPPRMTTAQKNAIATPTAGMVVFDTTLGVVAAYSGSAWVTSTVAASTLTTPGATSPVVYSAQISDDPGTVSNEIGNFITGNCTYATNRYTCTLTTTHSAKLNCSCSNADPAQSANISCGYDYANSSTSEIRFWTSANAILSARTVSVVCHGIL